MADEIHSTQIDGTFESSGKRERVCISCRLPYATYRWETYVDGEWVKGLRPDEIESNSDGEIESNSEGEIESNLGVRNDVLSLGLNSRYLPPNVKEARKRKVEEYFEQHSEYYEQRRRRMTYRGRRLRRAFTIDEVLEGAQADSGDEEGAQADSGDGVKFLGVVRRIVGFRFIVL